MSCSLSLITDELYPPDRPRSPAMMSTAARRTSLFSVVSGWVSLEYMARAARAFVSAWVYGADSMTRWRALTTREAAISSIARVIFLVAVTDRMRCR